VTTAIGAGTARRTSRGLIDKVDLAAVLTQILQAEHLLGVCTAAVKQASASTLRAVGVTVTARQYLVT